MSKIVILGAGHVGSLCALQLAASSICREIVLIDILEEKAAAQAKDVADATVFMSRQTRVRAGSYVDLDDADILVNAVGVSRKPGQTRLDLLDVSVDIMDQVIEQMRKTSFHGIIISISNPCDVVANYFRVHYDYPSEKIFGTGTSLDTARLRRTISEMAAVDMKSVTCYALGEHGDSSVVPTSQIRIGGESLKRLQDMDPERFGIITREVLEERTHQIGMEIVIGKGSTEFGIGAALADLCKAVLYDEHRVLPVSALLHGEYGQEDLMVGVPAVLGRNGVEMILELPVSEEEKRDFAASCAVVREYNQKAEKRYRENHRE